MYGLKEQIKRLHRDGHSLRDIAIVVNKTPHEVRQILAGGRRSAVAAEDREMEHSDVRMAIRELVMAIENDPRCREHRDLLRVLVRVGVGAAWERYVERSYRQC